MRRADAAGQRPRERDPYTLLSRPPGNVIAASNNSGCLKCTRVHVELTVPEVVKRVVLGFPSGDRIRGFLRRPEAAGFEVFPAVDGYRGEADSLFDDATFRDRWGREPKPGEKGCAVSHYLIVEKFAFESGEPDDIMLVTEDDSIIPEGFNSTVTAIANKCGEWEYVLLSDPITNRSRWDRIIDPRPDEAVLSPFARPVLQRFPFRVFRIGSYGGIAWGAGAYLVTRRGAQMFAHYVARANGGKVAWVADEFSYFKQVMGLRVALVKPEPIAEFRGESTINDESPFDETIWRKENRKPKVREMLAPRARLAHAKVFLGLGASDLLRVTRAARKPRRTRL